MLRARPLPVFPWTWGQCARVHRSVWTRPELPLRQVDLQVGRAPRQQEQPLRWMLELVHQAVQVQVQVH